MMNPGKIPVGDSFVSSSLLDSQATCSNGPISRRVVQMQEWAPAQEAFFPKPDSTTLNPIREPSTHHVTEAYKSRVRSLSMSLPGLTEHGSDDSNYGHALAKCRSHGLGSKQESKQYRAGEPSSSKHGHHGKLGRMLRRASISLRTGVREFMHRRPSVPTGSSFDNGESSAGAGLLSPPQDTYRPTSSHSPWHRLRKAASFQRHSRVLQLGPGDRHFERELEVIESPTFPIPGSGAHPPIIPRNTGAAARQAAAIACNGLPGHSWDWLESPAPRPGWLAEDELDDHESGIGIALSRADTETNLAADEADSDVDVGSTVCGDGADIVKVDFIAQLPTELAIHILSLLDAPALSTASRVSKAWNYVIRNQHIWRESFMREKTATYATSGPVKPGLGLGVPPVRPTNDWKEIYRVKEELDKHWKEGLAAPVYLTGHTDSIYCLQFDESKIITGSRDRTIRVWDIKTLACKLVIGPPEILNGSSTSLLYDDSGNPVHYAMFPDLDPTPTVDGQPRSALKACHSTPVLYSPPTHHKASILCLQYDDDILVTGSSDSTCIVYNIRSGYRPIRRLRHHSAAVLDLAFDDKHIVTCSKDVSICVWDRQTGALLKQLRGHAGPVNAVQLRGNTIVSCSGDFRVKLWNIDTGKNIREFLGHNKGLACSQFTEDGRYIASAGNDKVIRIWDANTGECVREMKAHENLVRSLHVDSVSGRLVSGSYDSDMKVWDMETGQPLLDFPKWHSSWVLSAKSDYRRMISTGQDPKILILDFGAGIKNIDMLESKSSKASAAELEQLERWHAEGGYI